jgi:hypothetical protein
MPGLLFLVGFLGSVAVQIHCDPAAVRLEGPGAVYSLLVHGQSANVLLDLTHVARYHSLDAAVAAVDDRGVIRAVADGTTAIEVKAEGVTQTVPVRVQGTAQSRSFNFANDIVPILSRFGCNAGGCHGKAEGQNGFKLSVFGSDPPADYAALTREGRGRRIFPAAPERSLLLTKPSGGAAHGGGVRLRRGTPAYETLRAWIAAGTPLGAASDPHVTGIRVEPRERTLLPHGQQQLRVIARTSDGREKDVTAQARFLSNNDALVTVNATGLVTAGDTPGDGAVMTGFLDSVDVFRVFLPRAGRIDPYPKLAENNQIDTLVYHKLRKLNVLPSEPAEDADYLRRVYLDVIGTLPTAEEARRYLADRRPDRRARLVDELLERPEFADYWALQWADLLRVDRQALGSKRAYSYYRWLRESFAANKPLDRMVRELVTAEGPLQESGPAAFYQAVPRPGDRASTLAQVFLGMRLACAECHHHPFDRWAQADYYGLAAYFTPLGVRGGPLGEELTVEGPSQAQNPRTGEAVPAHVLDAASPAARPGDGREELARWLTAPDNPWFARNVANRVWAHFLGRGLVEPVDDVRATNPPTNPELLDALAQHLVREHYDLRQLIRFVTTSRVYQLSSRPNATNERDEQNYSRALLKRIGAEVLLDMVCQTTGVPEKFPGVPAGYRAVQLWDSKTSHYFLKLFGRPARASACACERGEVPSISQVLHLLNGPEIHAKLAHDGGSVARMVRVQADDRALVEELFLTFDSRFPTAAERDAAVAYLRRHAGQRRQAAEDVAWGMLNSLEFLFNH